MNFCFFIWTRWRLKLLNNWINFKVQKYHKLIIQNVETWTWHYYRTLLLLNLTFHQILVSIEPLQRCGMPTGDSYSSGHLVPSLSDLHMLNLLRPILFRTNLPLFYRTILFEYPSVPPRFCFPRWLFPFIIFYRNAQPFLRYAIVVPYFW